MEDSRDKALKILIGVIAGAAVCFMALAIILVINKNSKSTSGKSDKTSKKTEVADGSTEEGSDTSDTEEVNTDVKFSEPRPSIYSEKVTLYNPEITATTAPYTVASDLSNVYNRDLYNFNDDEKRMLSQNYFFVTEYGTDEFFQVYESNRYNYQSSYVTVDSLMHTYHLYFAHLLKSLEKDQLSSYITNMSIKLLNQSDAQYAELKGTEWEEAAKRNVAFFATGLSIQGMGVDSLVADVYDDVNSEVSKINSASGISKCVITGEEEDYSQYKPRGYYDEDESLRTYFKAMMWYGRIQFNAKDEEMLKSAILMCIALNNAGIDEWKNVYDVTAFFAGTSDDLGFYEYYPLIAEIYGDNVDLKDMVDDEKSFKTFKREVSNLRLPESNSTPIQMGEENVIPGFRLMGQRFSIDATVMQNLIYQNVGENSSGDTRMLPDVLDVAAAFGSDTALDLLEEQGDTEYAGYTENMNAMRARLDKTSSDLSLRNSLSGMWLDTLRPLLIEKGEGYPSFMQSNVWARRDLECFAGSYTELKHDTVLYAKQCVAEMGDGSDIPVFDDRGYVQPEPVVYAKFAYLAEATRVGLQERGIISQKDAENLKKIEDMAKTLTTISEKELRDETLTDGEYDFIREYGGYIEHLWYDVMSADYNTDSPSTDDYKAALVIDVATDPNGTVLELGLGNPRSIYVVVNVDGQIKIAHGAVYDFYQFEWPLSDRLTDNSWRERMGFEPKSDGYYDLSNPIAEPVWWSQDYKYVYEY